MTTHFLAEKKQTISSAIKVMTYSLVDKVTTSFEANQVMTPSKVAKATTSLKVDEELISSTFRTGRIKSWTSTPSTVIA